MQSPLDMRLHPLDLSEFGRTPSGLSLYRVVWADSRTTKMFMHGRAHEHKRYEAYEDVAGKWILEKWLPPDKYLGMTRDEFDSLMDSFSGLATEPYPVDGEYELVHIFPAEVDETKTKAFVQAMEYRLRNVSLKDRKAEVVKEYEEKEEAKDEAVDHLLDDILGRDMPEPNKEIVYG